MAQYHQTGNRDKILFVNSFTPAQDRAVAKYRELTGAHVSSVIIFDHKTPVPDWLKPSDNHTLLTVDFADTDALQSTLKPYADDILTATFLADRNSSYFRKVIPLIPNCVLPTETSLKWTTEKIRMRSLLRNYDKSIAPNFTVAHDSTPETIEKIEKRVGYPLVVKPSGLTASLLVSICYHREELEKVLKQTFKKMDQIYKSKKGLGEPKILVEGFMEGTMYSIDAYVNARGVIYFAPLVYVKTGREVGFDDFFGYMRVTPTQLNVPHTEEAQEAATKGIKALGMRSTTCHIELMRTETGWKVIELGPRMGGFRHEMYELSFGIDHSLNDLLIRNSRKPVLPKKVKGYSALMQFYAKQEGKLEKIQGLFKIEAVESFKRVKVRKEPGDKCTFAKYGGDPVLDVMLFNPVRSNLLADIRRIEQALNIVVSSKGLELAKPTA
ncbi:MAG TPA: ATP-grasp domain-containing protein [Candidatus Saccharimonadia bacterium]|nr:ATP-grasp domain-containing protein [Candidatus Saccharimonadia bacterium]